MSPAYCIAVVIEHVLANGDFEFCDEYLFNFARWAKVVHKACFVSVMSNIESKEVSQGDCSIEICIVYA